MKTFELPTPRDASTPSLALGQRANWAQFSLLVLVNGFVGAMAGMERFTDAPPFRYGARRCRTGWTPRRRA